MIPTPTPETTDVTFTLPLSIPMPTDLQFITVLGSKRVRGGFRHILVDDLWLGDSEFVWASGYIVRKSDGTVGKYRDEGWLYLSELPSEVRAHMLDVVLGGVTTE